MQLNPPPKVRKAIYVTAFMGTALLAPLDLAGVIPHVVLAVWSSVSGAACLLAGVNVPKPE